MLRHSTYWGYMVYQYRFKLITSVFLMAALSLVAGCTAEDEASPDAAGGMQLRSAAFEDGGDIQAQYSCDGAGISPPLVWDHLPGETASLVLIMDDPDAAMGTWVHWLLYNIPPGTVGLPEDLAGKSGMPPGSQQGENSWKREAYGGPCPPSGEHRYFFRLYALDRRLAMDSGAQKKELIAAMEGHVLDQVQLVAHYRRPQ